MRDRFWSSLCLTFNPLFVPNKVATEKKNDESDTRHDQIITCSTRLLASGYEIPSSNFSLMTFASNFRAGQSGEMGLWFFADSGQFFIAFKL